MSQPPSPTKADSGHVSGIRGGKMGIPGYDHSPFSEEDLALAIKRSHLAVPGR